MWVVVEVLKVEESGRDGLVLIDLGSLACLLILLSFFVVSVEELIQTFNSWQLKHSG